MDGLELRFDEGPEGCWVRCRGELDLATAPRLCSATRELMRRGIAFTIDLSGLDFLDTSGLHALGLVQREAVGRAARVHVHSAPGTAAARLLALIEDAGLPALPGVRRALPAGRMPPPRPTACAGRRFQARATGRASRLRR